MRLNLRYDPQYDFYQLIGVEMSADTETIQRAYRQKAKEIHPDRNPERMEWATEQFQRLTEAYSILSDTELRSQYNDLRWAYYSRTGLGKPLPSSAASAARSRPTYNRPRHYTTRPGYKPVKKRGMWLEEKGMGWLRPFYLGVLELMTGPYRYVMPILGLILLCNGMLIFGGFFSPRSNSLLDERLATENGPTSTLMGGFISTPTPAPSVTSIVMPGNCSQYAVIDFPSEGTTLTADTMRLIGTVEHPDLYTYHVEVQMLGENPINEAKLIISLNRQPPILPESAIYHDQLVSLSPLLRYPAGYYRIILTIVHQNGSSLAACAVTFYKE